MKSNITTVVSTITLFLILLATPATAQQASEIEQLKSDLEQLQNRIDELEKRTREETEGDSQREIQLEQEDQAAGIDAQQDKAEPNLKIGGAIWVNYANQDWLGKNQGKRGLRFDNLRLSIDGDYDQFLMSAQ